MELQCEVLVPSHSSAAPDSSVSVADTREERLRGCCMPRFLILLFRGCSHAWEMLSCIPLRSPRLSQVCFLESSSLVCYPGCFFFFFPPSCLFSMVSRSLINSETGRNEETVTGERSRCPQTHPISMLSPHASDMAVCSLKIDHRQCHFLRTVIYHLITSGYSFSFGKLSGSVILLSPLASFFFNIFF